MDMAIDAAVSNRDHQPIGRRWEQHVVPEEFVQARTRPQGVRCVVGGCQLMAWMLVTIHPTGWPADKVHAGCPRALGGPPSVVLPSGGTQAGYRVCVVTRSHQQIDLAGIATAEVGHVQYCPRSAL